MKNLEVGEVIYAIQHEKILRKIKIKRVTKPLQKAKKVQNSELNIQKAADLFPKKHLDTLGACLITFKHLS